MKLGSFKIPGGESLVPAPLQGMEGAWTVCMTDAPPKVLLSRGVVPPHRFPELLAHCSCTASGRLMFAICRLLDDATTSDGARFREFPVPLMLVFVTPP